MFGRAGLDRANPRLAAAGRAAFGELLDVVAGVTGAKDPLAERRGRRDVMFAWSFVHGFAKLRVENRLEGLTKAGSAEEQEDIAALLERIVLAIERERGALTAASPFAAFAGVPRGENVKAYEVLSASAYIPLHERTHRRSRRAASQPRPARFRNSKPGSSTSTTRSIRAAPTCSARSTSASAPMSENCSNVDEAEADRIQKNFYRKHGTTLRGLMISHDIDPDEFLQFVHDIDHTVVQPDPALGAALLRLPGKKYIFTNGSRQHAEKVAERLGFPAHFDRHLRHRRRQSRAEAGARDL